MECPGTGSRHRLCTVTGITAIVQDDDEIFILNRIHDLFQVRSRKLQAVVIRQQSCRRFGEHYTVRSDFLQLEAVVLDECGTFLQQQLDCIRLYVAGHHNLGHVEQAARQRKRTDASGQSRLIRDVFGSQFIGQEILLYTSFGQIGHLQLLHGSVIRHETADHTGRFGFDRQVHDYRRRSTLRIGFIYRLDSLVMHPAIGHRIVYLTADHLDTGMGHNRQNAPFFAIHQAFGPILHISHKGYLLK